MRTYRGDAVARCSDELVSLVLSWNRPASLRRTVESLREQARGPVRVAVVDNGSDDETIGEIHRLIGTGAVDAAWFHPSNLGGVGLNEPLSVVAAPFVHFSENDLEYRSGWDLELLGVFAAVPDLGQLSVLSARPERALGEVWVDHTAEQRSEIEGSILVTDGNVGTTSIVRTSLLQQTECRPPLRWGNIVSGPFRWPNDGAFSEGIRQRGGLVAWHRRYLATNWGHNIAEWRADPEYYLAAHRHKRWIPPRELQRRLEASGISMPAEDIYTRRFR